MTDSLSEKQALIDFIDRVNADSPAPEDLARLRRLLAESPSAGKLGGDLAALAIDKMMTAPPFRGSSPFIRESVKVGLVALRRELGHDQAPPIEKLCIELITASWLNMYTVQYQYADVQSRDPEIAEGDYWEKRLSAAQKRYTRAIEALARVRRLLRSSAVQLNIGAQQVNVAGDLKNRAAPDSASH